MLRQLERVMKLDMCLRSPGRHTASSLAEHLEVSERTVRADIAFLRDRYHAPIECTRQAGYHYTDLNWRLPSIPLTRGELFALTLGARMLEAYAGSAYAPQLRSAVARLAERLPDPPSPQKSPPQLQKIQPPQLKTPRRRPGNEDWGYGD